MNDEQQQINQEFDNFHKAAANAIAACEAFIAMDINAPQEPVEAIFMGYKSKPRQASAPHKHAPTKPCAMPRASAT